MNKLRSMLLGSLICTAIVIIFYDNRKTKQIDRMIDVQMMLEDGRAILVAADPWVTHTDWSWPHRNGGLVK